MRCALVSVLSLHTWRDSALPASTLCPQKVRHRTADKYIDVFESLPNLRIQNRIGPLRLTLDNLLPLRAPGGRDVAHPSLFLYLLLITSV